MKISKSKRQLAQLLIEAGVTKFPEGANWVAHDGSGAGFYSGGKPYWDSKYHEWASNAEDGACVGVKILNGGVKNHHQTVLSRDEFDQIVAETVVRDEPDSDGWIEFTGTERPSGYFNKMIDVKLQDGRLLTDSSGRFEWDTDGPSKIIAYRLHKPDQAEPQYCDSVMRSIPEPTTAPTLDQLLQDWRNADDYAQRKQAEADEAAAMRDELWQAVQARAGEMGVTVGRREPVVAESYPVITDWRDLRIGDEVEVVVPNEGAVTAGERGSIVGIDVDGF